MKNKLVKLLLSLLPQLNNKSFYNNNNWTLDSSWAKQISKYVDKAPGKSTLNCCIAGGRVQNILWWDQNLPVISSLKNGVVLCGTNNLLKESPETIADGVIEIAETF